MELNDIKQYLEANGFPINVTNDIGISYTHYGCMVGSYSLYVIQENKIKHTSSISFSIAGDRITYKFEKIPIENINTAYLNNILYFHLQRDLKRLKTIQTENALKKFRNAL